MHDANASLDGSIGAPLVAATFLLCAVRDANTSLDSLFRAPLFAAMFILRAVHDAIYYSGMTMRGGKTDSDSNGHVDMRVVKKNLSEL